MDPLPLLDAEDSDSGRVDWRTGVYSILGFWAFYTGVVTLRALVMSFPDQGDLAVRRLLVTLVGIVATLLLWMVLRQFDRQRLAIRIIVAAIACIPAAIAFAAANYYFFNIYDAGSLPDVEQIAVSGGVTLYDSLTAVEIAEQAIWRYFFLIAWAALYLALSYAGNVRMAERRTAAFARAAQPAELRALRYPINPHFLFNTLNSLSALVMGDRKAEAEAMIMNLATFYRTGLAGDRVGDTSLNDEIELQQRYLAIEAVRFPSRLTVKIDVPPAFGDCALPGLILQPLVENAIKHGVSKTSQPVTLTIAARDAGQHLAITVSDDAPHGSPTRTESGIGLQNVRQRLAARYGSEATLRAAPLKGQGYESEIRLPIERIYD